MSLARREDDELARRSQGRFSRGGLETRPDVRPHSSQRADHAARLVVAPPHLRAYHRGGVGAPRSPAPSGARSNCRPLTPRNTQPRRAPAVVARARRGARRPLRHHRRGPLRSLPHLALPLTSSSPSQHHRGPRVHLRPAADRQPRPQPNQPRAPRRGALQSRPRQRTQHHAPRPASRRPNPRPQRQCHECHRPGGVRHRAAAGSGEHVPRVHARVGRPRTAEPPSPASTSKTAPHSPRKKTKPRRESYAAEEDSRATSRHRGWGRGRGFRPRPRPRPRPPRLRGRRFAPLLETESLLDFDDAASRYVDAPAPDNLTLNHPSLVEYVQGVLHGVKDGSIDESTADAAFEMRRGAKTPSELRALAGEGFWSALAEGLPRGRLRRPSGVSRGRGGASVRGRLARKRTHIQRRRFGYGFGLWFGFGFGLSFVITSSSSVRRQTSRSFGEYRGATVRRGA